MNLRPTSIATALALVLASAPAHAGPAGFAFLEIPSGARASAVGGAFMSVGRGVEAAFWNPAGLADVHGLQMTGSHFELVDGLRHSEFAVAGRAFGGGLSGSVRALYSEPIPERDEFGNLIGTFGSHDLEFAFGYGAPLSGGFDLGITAQLIRERIANSSAATYAFATGLAWRPQPNSNARFGVSMQNLGPSAHYTIDGVEGANVVLPAAIQGGMSWTHPMSRGMSLTGSLEGRFTTGRSGIGMVGAELASPVGAALRAGFRANDDAQNVSFGVGYLREGVGFDYAFVPYRYELGDTHRFAFTAQF
jgi:hypothetical protein